MRGQVVIPNAPARVPLWLAKRQWRLNGRKRGDGIYWPALLDLCRHMRWDPMPTYRFRWRWAPGWQRRAAASFYGYGPLPF